MNLWTYFLLFFKASLFSTGGTGNLPSLHSDLLARRWAVGTQFGEALAVGQISPGPSGLWVISLGYLTAGLPGALLALVAILIPPFLVIAIDRLYHRVQHHRAVEGFMRSLALSIVGIFVIVLMRLLHSNGINIRSAIVVAASLGLGATQRVPLVIILMLGAIAGIVFR